MSVLTSGAGCRALGAYDGPCVIVFLLLINFLQGIFPAYTWVPALQQNLQGKKRCNTQIFRYQKNQTSHREIIKLLRNIFYLDNQCLIGGTTWYQALWSVVRSLVLKNGPSNGMPAWPVHCPMSIQVVAPLSVPDSQVGAGCIQFHHTDTPSPCWDGYHPIVLWERIQNLK